MDNQKDLISIIIPVYNAEKSIEKCIHSIQESTYSNLEIIIVNDGSKDNTLHICNELKKKDERIEIIDKKNSGAGLSREKGLNLAKGKYIGFVDADDSIAPEMYEKLYNHIANNELDVCFCGNYEVFPDGSKKEKMIRFPQEVYTKEEVQKEVIRNSVWFTFEGSNENQMFSIWRGLYSADIIKNNDIHFLSERVVGSEDGIFNFQFLCNTNRLGFVHECLYYYIIDEGSLTHDVTRWDPKNDIRTNNWYNYICEYSKKRGLERYIMPYLNAEYLGKVRKAVNAVLRENSADFFEKYKVEKEKYIYLKQIRILSTKRNGIKNKIDFILCFYFIKIYKAIHKYNF